jgi:hypothetical protein
MTSEEGRIGRKRCTISFSTNITEFNVILTGEEEEQAELTWYEVEGRNIRFSNSLVLTGVEEGVEAVELT